VSQQNIYDNPDFFAGYKKLRDKATSLNEALEQPALWSLVGDRLDGLKVLDLGCGFGNFSRKARALGALSVTGVDISENMLAEAKKRTSDPRIEYRRASMEELELEPQIFDLVVSSLMLHYVCDYPSALRKIASCLKPGGRLVFCVEHPINTARTGQEWIRIPDPDSGADADLLYWPVDRYRPEGEIGVKWFVDGVVKYHRTMETYINGLIDAGFALRRLLEPAPAEATRINEVDLERRRPAFLLISATLS